MEFRFIWEEKNIFFTKKNILMQHQDALWKGAVEDFFPAFLAYFYSEYIHLIDSSKEVEFLDKELQKISPQSKDSRRYVDKLAKIHLKNGETKWILIHIEIQGYLDKNFGERMFIYQYRIFDQYKVKVAALAILTDNNKNFHPKEYRSEIFGTSILYQFPTYKLMDKTEDDFKDSTNPFAIIMEAAWLGLGKNKMTQEQLFSKKINLYKKLVRQTSYSEKQIHGLLTCIKYFTPFDTEEINLKFDKEITNINKNISTMGVQEALLNSYKEEGIEIGVEQGVEKGLEQGLSQGLEQGLEKGRGEGVSLTLQIVSMLKDGKSVAKISKELKIPKQTILEVKQIFDL